MPKVVNVTSDVGWLELTLALARHAIFAATVSQSGRLIRPVARSQNSG
jgi:hypothetical protein